MYIITPNYLADLYLNLLKTSENEMVYDVFWGMGIERD